MKRAFPRRSPWDALLPTRRCVCGNPLRLNDLFPPSSLSKPTTIPKLPSRLLHTTPSLRVIPSLAPTQSAKLAALHGRLSLPTRYPLATLGRALIDPTAEKTHHLNNDSLSQLGNVLTGYYVSEYLMVNYPRIPFTVLKTAMIGYIGPESLAAIGKGWGVEAAFAPGETVDPGLLQFVRLQPGERWLPTKGGIGYNTPRQSSRFYGEQERSSPGEAIPLEHAMANFVRAVVGGVYLHAGGLSAAKEFVHNHILSRKLSIDKMFQFEQPTRELSRLCLREGFQPPVARLEKESGRYSRHPVYIVGVYSGEEKLGEGQGGSLPEAKIKAAISALKGWYLYSPVEKELPSVTDGDPLRGYKGAVVDVGDVIS